MPSIDGPFEGTLFGFTNPDPIKFCTDDLQNKLQKLKKIAPNAAVFTSTSLWITNQNQSETETALLMK